MTSWRWAVCLCILLFVFGLPAQAVSSVGTPADDSDAGPWLTFDFSLGWGMGPPGMERPGGVRFEIQASDGGPFKKLFHANYDKLKWFPYAVNLSEYAGKTIRLRLMVEHLDGRIHMDYAYWGHPQLVVGPLDGKDAPCVIKSLAMTPIDRVGGVLADQTEIDLPEKDPVFFQDLTSPGRLNREAMLLVYAGDKYISVPGTSKPGIYMGISMSVDHERIGAGPDGAPWTGKMPPTVFAEWKLDIPKVAAQEKSSQSPTTSTSPMAFTIRPSFDVLQYQTDVYKYQPGFHARCDAEKKKLDVSIQSSAIHGWAFAGIESLGQKQLPLRVDIQGQPKNVDDNSFAGVVIDYHTAQGYQKRVWFGLGAGSDKRYDLRPAGWIFDRPALLLSAMLSQTSEFIDALPNYDTAAKQLTLDLARHAPIDWDGRFWLAAGVQNQPAGVGLTVQVNSNTPDALAAEPVILEDDHWRFELSASTGAIVGAWDKASQKKLVKKSFDRYIFESDSDVIRTTELIDVVQSVRKETIDGRPAITLTCMNIALPDVTIEKHYTFDSARVFSKRVTFSTADEKGLFVHYNAETALDETFLSRSSRGGDLVEKTVVAQGKVVTKSEAVVAEQVSSGDAPVVIANDYSLGVAAYRYKVNDRFVLKGNVKGTSDGWILTGFCDYFKKGHAVSCQTRLVAFAGDFTVFVRHYQSLPEFKQLWDYAHPDWTSKVVADAMYFSIDNAEFFKACQPYVVTETIWFLNPPWGNWWGHSDPPKSSHPDVCIIAPDRRKWCPNSKISAYTCVAFDDKSDVFKQHPQFAFHDVQGRTITTGISSDAGGRPTYHFQINDPACRKYMLDMHVDKITKWGLDFYYMDGPGFGAEMPDWRIRDVVQNYDWLDYMKELRARLQQIRPDIAVFVNGTTLPSTDLGYIEYRAPQWQSLTGEQWRPIALTLFRAKLEQPAGFIIIPTYGSADADPALSAYNVMYGWCGNLSEMGRLPWMKYAMNYRDTLLVEDAVEPRWWRTNVDYEAYGFTKKDRGIVHILSHENNPCDITVTVNIAKLGLDESRPLSATLFTMTDPTSEEKDDPNNPGKKIRVWKNTSAFQQKELFRDRPASKVLKLTIPTTPNLVSTVVLYQAKEAN